MSLKDSKNVISICSKCFNCVDCCNKDIQCEDFHLTYLQLAVAKIGNAGTDC